ncbi:hypothetical protein MTP99_016675 [Tenebrio molitor]|uniref:uncharacterized protein isoform X1 n=1 Tax=Tenebrio molitor TaxID=7067 RepID=UPI001C39F877|nr:hypothetical protein MTP99_016675 [Tenebrio molitor]CAH1375225.1 unnamed protein product [Tenebrio molitor]
MILPVWRRNGPLVHSLSVQFLLRDPRDDSHLPLPQQAPVLLGVLQEVAETVSCIDGGGCCLICKYAGKFEKSDVNSEFLKKLKMKPGIGRPYRYNTKKVFHFEDKFNNHNVNATTENLYGSQLEKSQGDGFTPKSLRMLRSVSATTMSRRPLTCLHDGCKKSVAVSSLVSHFKHDHGAVPCFGIEKGRELRLLFDVSLVEHDRTFCLAMITVYEFNNIDVVRSKSSQSVINTCSKLSGRVPINTFWLMMSGSTEYKKSGSYVVYWLYSNSEDRFWCTMELSSKNDKVSVSSFCSAVGLHESRTVEEVARNMNCLFVSHGSFVALLSEGDKINLRITLH